MGRRIPIIINGRRQVLWDEVEQPQQQENAEANHFQNPATDLPMESIMSIPQNKPASEEEQHRTAERKYWRRQNWITGIGAAVAVVSLFFLYRTLKITQDQLLTSQRPWVGILDLTTESPLIFDARGGHITVSYKIKNGGNSPAIAVVTETSLFVAPTNDLLKQIGHGQGCDRDFINAVTKVAGTFLLPGETLPMENHEVVTVEPLKAEKPQAVWLHICVGYRDQFKEIHGVGLNWAYVTETKTSEFEPRGTLNGTFESRGIFGFMNAY